LKSNRVLVLALLAFLGLTGVPQAALASSTDSGPSVALMGAEQPAPANVATGPKQAICFEFHKNWCWRVKGSGTVREDGESILMTNNSRLIAQRGLWHLVPKGRITRDVKGSSDSWIATHIGRTFYQIQDATHHGFCADIQSPLVPPPGIPLVFDGPCGNVVWIIRNGEAMYPLVYRDDVVRSIPRRLTDRRRYTPWLLTAAAVAGDRPHLQPTAGRGVLHRWTTVSHN
jgi:hypothetical protein